ncbi:MAG: hypothetical protein RJQ00_12205 [Vicingaceae bacterium]
MKTRDIIESWKNPELRSDNLNLPVANNLDLELIMGKGDGDGAVHSVSGECNAMDHVHDCQTASGFVAWVTDGIYSLIGWQC